MASGPTLPPQAYTREILTAAFNWLQSQPDSVRKLATTPDALVGLYMRAQRYGNSNLETDAPVSGQNFMSDLKNLAEGLKQFEEAPAFGGQTGSSATSMSESRTETRLEPRPDTRPDLRSDLRELREMRRSQITPPPQNPAPPQGAGAYVHSHFSQAQPAPQTYQPAPVQQQMMAPAQMSGHGPANFVSRDMALAAMTAILNDRSLAMIQDVKGQMNLSSDAEAVNMMISLAYKSLKNLIV